MTGATIGPYHVVEKLGEGGMGVVYKAHDPRLGRVLAVKVLRADAVANAARAQRFLQEAKAASALNHPSIVTIYEIGRADGVDFIAMEFVQGRTLDQVVGRRGLRLPDLLKYATQAADALAKAHAAGIVHRDLKPSNMMVTDDGLLKILDFGLAKLAATGNGGDVATTLGLPPAGDLLRTADGQVMGTPVYMSPEQAEGKAVDARSDIFSFGSVLYEMATGTRAFQGETAVSTLAAVLSADPKPLTQSTPGLPRELERIITRCLRKDPARRFQSIADVAVELDEVRVESGDSFSRPAPSAPARRRRPWAIAAAAGALLVAAGGWWVWPRSEAAPPLETVTLTAYIGNEVFPSLSPDGSQVAFVWTGEQQDNTDIYLKPVNAVTPLRLTTDPAVDTAPAWSPDGTTIAFLRGSGDQRAIYLTPPVPGSERKLADVRPETLLGVLRPAGSVAWSPDGQWLAVAEMDADEREGGIVLIAVNGGERRRVIWKPFSEGRFVLPVPSPRGDALAYANCPGGSSTCDVWTIALRADLTPNGEPRQLTRQHVAVTGIAWMPDARSIVYSATSNMAITAHLWRIAVSGGSDPERLGGADDRTHHPSISTTGYRLAASRGGTQFDIFRLNVESRTARPFLSSTLSDVDPEFSPDGRFIAFASARDGRSQPIWIANADGTGLRQLSDAPVGRLHGAPRWSPDGRRIAFNAQRDDGQWDIDVIDAAGGQARALTSGPANDNNPSWSADGRWIYFSSRGGIWRVAVSGGDPTQVAEDGGQPRESPDGTMLYFARGGAVYGLPTAGGAERRILQSTSGSYFPIGTDIYYFAPSSPPSPGVELRVFSVTSGRTETLYGLDLPAAGYLTVSADRKTALWRANSSTGFDLMLLENFR